MKDEAPNASAMRTAWLVVALLVPVALLNYLDRQMLAAMKTSMMNDIPDIGSKANWGLVLGSFKWVYPSSARWVDTCPIDSTAATSSASASSSGRR